MEDVYLGAGKVLENARRGGIIGELSTVAPETSHHLHQVGRELGISVLDVAISGSTTAAESGSLTLFGGGARADFEAADPIFRAIAAQWLYIGFAIFCTLAILIGSSLCHQKNRSRL